MKLILLVILIISLFHCHTASSVDEIILNTKKLVFKEYAHTIAQKLQQGKTISPQEEDELLEITQKSFNQKLKENLLEINHNEEMIDSIIKDSDKKFFHGRFHKNRKAKKPNNNPPKPSEESLRKLIEAQKEKEEELKKLGEQQRSFQKKMKEDEELKKNLNNRGDEKNENKCFASETKNKKEDNDLREL